MVSRREIGSVRRFEGEGEARVRGLLDGCLEGCGRPLKVRSTACPSCFSLIVYLLGAIPSASKGIGYNSSSFILDVLVDSSATDD